MWATLERRSFKTVSRVVPTYAMLHAALHRHLFTIVGTIARAHHRATERTRDRTIAIAPPHRRAPPFHSSSCRTGTLFAAWSRLPTRQTTTSLNPALRPARTIRAAGPHRKQVF
ncbi:hypothetical protein [Burkholderia multivorans]|uniref:hypothetical protein n=1 Tax=Burkholderia multivorans TaxID=87883 RepID=UPI001591DFD9|nr:hypothetical protein [Burkholderia multivorans]MCA8334471.1 hypothetical protein [Burkholderia multivorans]UXZ63443.1 hypothetical protein NUJ28_24725 [Burkholderia multivorans]